MKKTNTSAKPASGGSPRIPIIRPPMYPPPPKQPIPIVMPGKPPVYMPAPIHHPNPGTGNTASAFTASDNSNWLQQSSGQYPSRIAGMGSVLPSYVMSSGIGSQSIVAIVALVALSSNVTTAAITAITAIACNR